MIALLFDFGLVEVSNNKMLCEMKILSFEKGVTTNGKI